jgi:tetratricopeptide (TPR) repeat protein
LVNDFPGVLDYAVFLGAGYCNLGGLVNDGGHPEEALELLGKAIDTLSKVLKSDKRQIRARQFLINSYMNRAQALDRLKRHVAAIKDLDHAVELAQGAPSPSLRVQRAGSLASAGEYRKAAPEADALAKNDNATGDTLYDAACVYGLCSAAANRDAKLNEVERKKIAEEYAGRAVILLQRATARGWKDVGRMKEDSDLDSLRQREDFKKLIRELELKTGGPRQTQAPAG